MTNKEILANLKKSYEYLYDIRENGCGDHCNGQIENDATIDCLESALCQIQNVYSDFYKTLNKSELDTGITILGNKIFIGDNVDCDYSVEDQYTKEFVDIMSCGDLDFYWYDDIEFLNKDKDNDYEK